MADAPSGPSSEEEATFLSTDRPSEAAYSPPLKTDSAEPEPGDTSLPPLEDLVKRIPAPTRELMEELFRARFVTVKRIPARDLKA